MKENTYSNMHLADLTSLPPSSPPIIAASDSPEPIDGVGREPPSPLSVLSSSPEDETDLPVPDQQPSNNVVELITPYDRACDWPNSMTPPRYRGRTLVGGEGSDPGVYLSSPVLSKEDRKRKAKADKENTWMLKRH